MDNPTQILSTIFQKAKMDAINNKNSEISKYHILKILLEDKISGLFIYLRHEVREKVLFDVVKKIKILPIVKYSTNYSISGDLYRILQDAEEIREKRGDKLLSQISLIIAFLGDEMILNILKTHLKDEEIKNIKERIKLSKPVNLVNDDEIYGEDIEAIKDFVSDLTEEARNGKLDPVIGRENEIQRVLRILNKKTKSNVILVGLPGVGKTAIIKGISILIAKKEVNRFENYRVISLDVGSIISGTTYRGDFEKKMRTLITYLKNNRNTILFIDEIHTLLGMGTNSDNSLDAANILKPYLASGEIKVIGATTFDEYRKYVEKDSAFERRFTKITVNEPTPEDTLQILRGLRSTLEAHHGVKIEDSSLVYSSINSKRYVTDRRLPDVALDLVDTACASKMMDIESESPELRDFKRQLWSLDVEKASIQTDLEREIKRLESTKERFSNQHKNDSTNKAKMKSKELESKLKRVEDQIEVKKQKIKELEEHFDKENYIIVELRRLKKEKQRFNFDLGEARRNNDTFKAQDISRYVLPKINEQIESLENTKSLSESITPNDIASIINQWTGIPIERLTVEDTTRLEIMESNIKKRIFGQNPAVKNIVNAIISSRLGFSDPDKPASFLFIGPTGIGKTELAKTISYELFDDKSYLKLDMSDYSTEISVTKLVGAPAGYIGYGEGGTLTDPVRQKPYNVILLDEIDHAHPRVLNLLYQILDEGRVVDGKGNVVNFKNTIIIMTSNLCQNEILEYLKSSDEFDGEGIYQKVKPILSKFFGAPLLNRIDKTEVFKPLEFDDLVKIFGYHLKILRRRFSEKKITLNVSDSTIASIIEKNYDIMHGARPIKKYMDRIFITGISKVVLRLKKFDEETKIYVDVEENKEKNGLEKLEDYYFYLE